MYIFLLIQEKLLQKSACANECILPGSVQSKPQPSPSFAKGHFPPLPPSPLPPIPCFRACQAPQSPRKAPRFCSTSAQRARSGCDRQLKNTLSSLSPPLPPTSGPWSGRPKDDVPMAWRCAKVGSHTVLLWSSLATFSRRGPTSLGSPCPPVKA